MKKMIDKFIVKIIILILLIIILLPNVNAENLKNESVKIASYNQQSSYFLNDYTNINVIEAWDFLTDTSNGIQIPIDVRQNYEWNDERIDTPVPENPRHYCLDLLQDPETLEQFIDLYDGIDIIFYCKSGGRSASASSILSNTEFNGTIYNMVGGIGSWKTTGYPILEGGITNITVEEAYELFNSLDNGLQKPIDVRTLEEWLEEYIDTPFPENASHYPLSYLQDEIKLQHFLDQFFGQETVLYCHSGGRSLIAAEILIENQFTGTVYNMLGGIVSWRDAGYPTVTVDPDLSATGTLIWNKIEPGTIVQSEIIIENIGDNGSLLDWEIETFPEWGSWIFEPSSGNDLSVDNELTVYINITSPEDIGSKFTGEVKIINKEDPEDFVILPVNLETPRFKDKNFNFLLRFFDLFENPIIVLKNLFGLLKF